MMDKIFKTEYGKFIVTRHKNYFEWEQFFVEQSQSNPEFVTSLEARIIQTESLLSFLNKPIEWKDTLEAALRYKFLTEKSYSGNWSNGLQTMETRR
jgi:hypothetical protein